MLWHIIQDFASVAFAYYCRWVQLVHNLVLGLHFFFNMKHDFIGIVHGRAERKLISFHLFKDAEI